MCSLGMSTNHVTIICRYNNDLFFYFPVIIVIAKMPKIGDCPSLFPGKIVGSSFLHITYFNNAVQPHDVKTTYLYNKGYL